MVNTTANQVEEASSAPGGASFLDGSEGIMSWVLSADHKRIGFIYLLLALLFIAVSGVLGAVARFTTDGSGTVVGLYAGIAGLLVLPAIPASLGNFVLPLQIGAQKTAVPPLNTVGLLLYLLGAALSFVAAAGAGDGSPLLVVGATVVVCLSIMCVSINLVLTMHFLRAPSMSWFRVPLFSWGVYTASLAMVIATKLIVLALIVTAVFPSFALGVFHTGLGAEAVLFQYVNSFASYPLAFVFVLPALAMQSDIIAAATKRVIVGYQSIAFSCFGIALMSLCGWVVCLVFAPDNEVTIIMLSFVSLACSVFVVVHLLNLAVTMKGGRMVVHTPVVFSLGFVFLSTIGCFGGVLTHTLSIGSFLEGTAFATGQNHYFLVGGCVMGLLGGAYFWWPKMTGRMYSDSLGKIGALIMLVGANLAFFPQLMIGTKGVSYRHAQYLSQFDGLQSITSAGVVVLLLGLLLSIVVLFMSLTGGETAEKNPWGANTLEWSHAATPPVQHNFSETPVVSTGPYQSDA